MKKAIFWVGFWFVMAMAFCFGILLFAHNFQASGKALNGQEMAIQFLGGYVIELSLSVDNLFVFLMVFCSFSIPGAYQRRVLTYGIIGAIVLRLLFIYVGIKTVQNFTWVLYIFGFILIFSGVKMMLEKEEHNKDCKNNKTLHVIKKFMPFTDNFYDEKFFIKKKNPITKKHILYATPLFAVLVVIECSDIIFAIDSIPAILSFTDNLFIAYTSNLFAIMGLRSMYFLLEKMNAAFRFMKFGVAAILTFTGVKLALPALHYISGQEYHIDSVISIVIIVSILMLSILASVVVKEKVTVHE